MVSTPALAAIAKINAAVKRGTISARAFHLSASDNVLIQSASRGVLYSTDRGGSFHRQFRQYEADEWDKLVAWVKKTFPNGEERTQHGIVRRPSAKKGGKRPVFDKMQYRGPLEQEDGMRIRTIDIEFLVPHVHRDPKNIIVDRVKNKLVWICRPCGERLTATECKAFDLPTKLYDPAGRVNPS